MIKDRNIAPDAWISPSKIAGAGIGEVFYVCKNSTAGDKVNYNWLAARVPSDNLFTTIQAALDETQECRNDYVLVWPSDSDYDITAALTMSKKCVHLIGVGGLGLERGATNAVRIEQTTAATAVIAVSDASVEIAGLYLKSYIGREHITLSNIAYACNIHHNTFPLWWTSSNQPVIVGTGMGGAYGDIHHNWIFSSGGDDQTCASLIDIKSNATCARVNYNDFMMGDGNTATIGISNAATKGSCNYNTFAKAGTDGTYTHCIAVGSYGTAIGNRGTVADSIMVTGGASDATFSDNMNGVNGGLVDDED